MYKRQVGDKVERVALKSDDSTVIFGKNGCPFCEKAVTFFDVRGIDYEYVNLEDIGKSASEVTGRPVTTVPQIYVAGSYVGGYTDLIKWYEEHPIKEQEEEDTECRACEG